MKKLALFAVGALAACSILPGCTQQQSDAAAPRLDAAAHVAGQLFCSFQLRGGGDFVAGVVNAAAAAANPTAGAGAIIATGAGKAYVDAVCAAAARNIPGGISGVPVSPPARPDSVGQIAVVPPPESTPPKP